MSEYYKKFSYNAGVRGAMWIVTWGILFLSLSLFYPVVELEVTVQTKAGNNKSLVYTLAIGDGCARSLEDPVACHDLQRLREGMHKVNPVQFSIVKPIPKYINEVDLY